MMASKEPVEQRALKIAVKIINAAGICRYEDVSECRKTNVDARVCEKCIRSWLISKAKKELERK